jgi:hypothetical protein
MGDGGSVICDGREDSGGVPAASPAVDEESSSGHPCSEPFHGLLAGRKTRPASPF